MMTLFKKFAFLSSILILSFLSGMLSSASANQNVAADRGGANLNVPVEVVKIKGYTARFDWNCGKHVVSSSDCQKFTPPRVVVQLKNIEPGDVVKFQYKMGDKWRTKKVVRVKRKSFQPIRPVFVRPFVRKNAEIGEHRVVVKEKYGNRVVSNPVKIYGIR